MAKTYTTVQGDMWDAIAYRLFSDVAYTDKLMNLNQQYREYYTFPADIVLNLPEISTDVVSSVPPWKQVTG